MASRHVVVVSDGSTPSEMAESAKSLLQDSVAGGYDIVQHGKEDEAFASDPTGLFMFTDPVQYPSGFVPEMLDRAESHRVSCLSGMNPVGKPVIGTVYTVEKFDRNPFSARYVRNDDGDRRVPIVGAGPVAMRGSDAARVFRDGTDRTFYDRPLLSARIAESGACAVCLDMPRRYASHVPSTNPNTMPHRMTELELLAADAVESGGAEAADAAVQPADVPEDPEIAVVVFTRNRTLVACACVRSLIKNLKYGRPLHWVVSDDRSEPGHVSAVMSVFREEGVDMDLVSLVRTSNDAYGLGASMNNGLKAGFSVADLVLRTEDDWFPRCEIDLGMYVPVLSDSRVCCVHMGYEAAGNVAEEVVPGFARVAGLTGLRYVMKCQVAMVNRTAMAVVGQYLRSGWSKWVEQTAAARFNEATGFGRRPPYVVVDTRTKPYRLNDGPLFTHAGGVSAINHDYGGMDRSVADLVSTEKATVADDPMRICVILDDAYAGRSAVTVRSAALSMSGPGKMPVEFHVVEIGELSAESEGLLRRAAAGMPVKFTRLVGEALRFAESVHPKRDAATTHTMSSEHGFAPLVARYMLPDLMDFDRVLYLDSDIVVRGDLAEMWFTDMSGADVAGVEDAWNIGLPERARIRYINAGVMLMNLGRCRETGLGEKCIDIMARQVHDFPLDQNAVNLATIGSRAILPLRFNVPVHYIMKSWRPDGKFGARINGLYGTSYRSPDEVVNDAAVLHYCTPSKPWRNESECSDIWNFYRDTLYTQDTP